MTHMLSQNMDIEPRTTSTHRHSVREGWTPLHCACAAGHLDVVKVLHEVYQVNVGAEDYLGCTALHVAARKGDAPLVEYLIEFAKVGGVPGGLCSAWWMPDNALVGRI